MSAFELTHAALNGEVWRLWTGHLVHWDTAHLFLNVAALAPLVFLRPRLRGPFVAAALLAGAPLISIAVLLMTDVDQYRGASALVVMLWVLLPLCSFGGPKHETAYAAAVLASVTLKIAYELAVRPLAWHPGAWSTVPQAHVAGAIAGILAAAAAAWLRMRSGPRSAGVPRPRL